MVEQPGNDPAEEAVQDGEEKKRNHESRHWCYGVSRAQYSGDDPRLAPDFRYRPSCLNGDESQRRTKGDSAQEPTVAGQIAAPQRDPSDPQ
jgi:hypothetical protein